MRFQNFFSHDASLRNARNLVTVLLLANDSPTHSSMKRADLVRHLRRSGCQFVREGARHSVFRNPENDFISTVPRHAEIDSFLARKICKDLGISVPRGK